MLQEPLSAPDPLILVLPWSPLRAHTHNSGMEAWDSQFSAPGQGWGAIVRLALARRREGAAACF